MSAYSSRHRAYFAAPLFNEMERNFNLTVTTCLESCIDVFLPQRDGGLLMNYVRDGVPPDQAAKVIFEKDLAAMEAADFLIAVLDGSNVDEGVAFEIGYMFSLGKICLGLQTDVRRALPTGNNPMIGSAMRAVLQSTSELVTWVEQYSHEEKSSTQAGSLSVIQSSLLT